MSDIQTSARLVVLDTNVCLDLYIFQDPRWAGLLSQLEQCMLQAVTSASCREEWRLVLEYKKFALTEGQRNKAMQAFDGHHQLWDKSLLPEPSGAECPKILPRLPVCKDKDDQKFLELAADAKASVLITKDKALLRLAGKCRRDGLFEIMTPAQWCAANPVTAALT